MTFDPKKSTVGDLIAAVEAGDPGALAHQQKWVADVGRLHGIAAEARRALDFDFEAVSRAAAEAARAKELAAVERETRIMSAVEEVATRARGGGSC